MLDGSRLVGGDVCGVGAEDALIGPQHGRYDGGVGLCATLEEVYVRVRDVEYLAYAACRVLAVIVLAVAGILFEICLLDNLEQVGVGPTPYSRCKITVSLVYVLFVSCPAFSLGYSTGVALEHCGGFLVAFELPLQPGGGHY